MSPCFLAKSNERETEKTTSAKIMVVDLILFDFYHSTGGNRRQNDLLWTKILKALTSDGMWRRNSLMYDGFTLIRQESK